jgi:predicted membrane protein
MNIKLKKRNFFKKILLSLTIIPLLNFNLFFFNNNKYKLIKKKNLIWYLNDGD